MKKKVLLGLGALVVAVAGVVAMSAFEAHVINVIAHIENALAVSTEALDFGTVFPQEYLEKDFTISLSESFIAADRVDDVEYVIKQKPKPIWDDEVPAGCASGAQTVEQARAYCHEHPEDLDCCYLSLCPYLSKINEEEDEDEEGAENDSDSPSYYVEDDPDTCNMCQPEATGKLSKEAQDTEDRWVVDLKVPPFAGYVAQDWPESCPVLEGAEVSEEGTDLGCDLWIEVTEISERVPYEPCEGWTECTVIKEEKDFFVTGRYGDGNPTAGAWELAIWDAQLSEVVVTQDNYGWVDNQVSAFSLSYNPGDGAVVYTVGDKTLNWTYNTGKAFDRIVLFAKGNANNNNATLSDLVVDGMAVPDVFSGTGYVGLVVYLTDAQQVDGFTVTGSATLDWDTLPEDEIPGFHVFAMGTHDLPQ